MAPNLIAVKNKIAQKEFFTSSSFATLAGSVTITWVMTAVICDVFGISSEMKIVLFCVSMFVSLVGVIVLHEKPGIKQFLIAICNAFLLYMSVAGLNTMVASPAARQKDDSWKFEAHPSRPAASAFRTNWFQQ